MNSSILFLTSFLLFFSQIVAWAQPQIYGFNYPCWGKDCYQTSGADENLDALAKTGARWVAIVPTWYMASGKASAMGPTDSSPSDAALSAVISRAKSLGLSVELKPHVDRLDGGSRSELTPANPAAWFAAYKIMMIHYAQMAAKEHVDMLVIGTELSRLDGQNYRANWTAVISAVRKVYAGRLTYAANWDAFSKVSFWDQLDYIGIDAYFPIPGNPSEKNMIRGWKDHKSALSAAVSGYGKPVLFTEIGIASEVGANANPWKFDPSRPVDLNVQKNYFQAFLEVFSDASWFGGFMQWAWETDPNLSGPQNANFTVQGKPALDILKSYFALWNGQAPKDQGLSAEDQLKMKISARRALSLIQDLPKVSLP